MKAERTVCFNIFQLHVYFYNMCVLSTISIHLTILHICRLCDRRASTYLQLDIYADCLNFIISNEFFTMTVICRRPIQLAWQLLYISYELFNHAYMIRTDSQHPNLFYVHSALHIAHTFATSNVDKWHISSIL